MFVTATSRWRKRIAATLFFPLLFCSVITAQHTASAKLLDNGVDSANLGKGEWIYILSSYFGGYVPSVSDNNSLMAYLKTNLGCQFVIIKAADGPTLVYGPQFTPSLVSAAHSHGLKIFGYTRSTGTDPVGESAVADYVNGTCAADGFIFDAEDEWLSLVNPADTAWKLCGMVKTNWPNRLLAHTPYADIQYKFGNPPSFPYKEFGYWCDSVMPQVYWQAWADSSSPTVQQYGTPQTGIGWMDSSFKTFHSSLSSMGNTPLGNSWTNAIKPLAPIGQAFVPGAAHQTYADMTNFISYLRTDPSPATPGGYKGGLFFRVGLQDQQMLDGIAAGIIGDFPPTITNQPQGQTVVVGQVAAFNVLAGGPPAPKYQWRRNGTNLASATLSSYSKSGIQLSDAGSYSVIVSNSLGTVTSANAILTVVSVAMPPSILTPPQSQAVAAAQSPAFTVTASGTATLKYQWFFNGSTLSGATNTAYTVTNAAAGNSGSYSVRVTNNVGAVTSQVATLSVIPDLIVDDNDAACVTVGTWSVGTTSTDKYGADYKNTSALTPGKSATYTPNIPTAGLYDVSIWYPQGSNRSSAAPWTVNYDSGSVTVAMNQQSGGGGWRTVTTGKKFNAGTGGNVQLNNTQPDTSNLVMADAVRWNFAASQPPSVITSPQSQSVKVGNGVAFAEAASGTPPLTYQWQKNNAAIAGATQGLFNIANAQFADAGSYRVIVSNASGSATSGTATLTVTAPAFSFGSVSVAPDQKAHLQLGGDTNTYIIEATADFATWQPLTNIVVTNGVMVECIDPLTNNPQRFYRARVGP